LNLRIPRYSADPTATENIRQYYETKGNLVKPLVMGHTTRDPIQLFWHLPLYQLKTIQQGTSALFSGIPVDRYGHCTFTEAEIIAGFSLLVQKVKGSTQPPLAKVCSSDGRIVESVQWQQK
jgi:hypothetical protein